MMHFCVAEWKNKFPYIYLLLNLKSSMKHFLLIGLVFLIYACRDNHIHFDQPQPERTSDLKQFPFWYRGQYLSKDSSLITINKKLMIKRSEFVLTFIKSQDDTLKSLLANKDRDTLQKIWEIGDSIFVKQINIDTIFDLSKPSNIARKFKGNLTYTHRSQQAITVASSNIQHTKNNSISFAFTRPSHRHTLVFSPLAP
jgi:hypothetical protein